MKKIKLVLIFCILGVVTFAVAQQESLTLKAAFDKSEYRVGEPIKLLLKMTNNSSTDHSLRWAPDVIKIFSGGEQILKRKGMAGARGSIKGLDAGASMTNTFEFTSEFFDLPATGNYTVQVIYKNDVTETFEGVGVQTKFHKGGRMARKLWVGEISASTSLNIVK